MRGWGFQVLSLELLKCTSVHPRLTRNFYTKAETMCLVPCFITVICFYAIRNWFLSTFFAWVAAELAFPGTKTGVPNNKDHSTLSVLTEASGYGSWSTPSSTVLWEFSDIPGWAKEELAIVSDNLIAYI